MVLQTYVAFPIEETKNKSENKTMQLKNKYFVEGHLNIKLFETIKKLLL